MTDTPRDPLAELMDPENAPAVHGAWYARTRRQDDIQLIDDDGCTLFVSQDDVAALVAFRLDATRPSGDEGLREAVQFLPEMVGEPNPEGWSLVRRKDVLALLGEPR